MMTSILARARLAHETSSANTTAPETLWPVRFTDSYSARNTAYTETRHGTGVT